MARLTVEDCLVHVENRFDLVLKASKRARVINHGGESIVVQGKDKATIVALREIATGHVTEEMYHPPVIPLVDADDTKASEKKSRRKSD